MTPKELAEKILKTFNPVPAPKWLMDEVESLLSSVLEEIRQDGFNHGLREGCKSKWEEARAAAFAEGRLRGHEECKEVVTNSMKRPGLFDELVKETKSLAYESCAKIADAGMVDWEIHLLENADKPNLIAQHAFIADKIRQAAKEMK